LDRYRQIIEEQRVKIDAIDEQMVVLLNQRANHATEIGHAKRHLNLPVYVPEREEQVIENVQKKNPGPLSNEAIRRLYERIIDESRRLERERFVEQQR
jgi:chorismate mutase